MQLARLAFAPRFVVYTLTLVLTVALLLTVLTVPASSYIAGVPLVLFGGLAVLGTRDLIQTRHAVLRNYPITAHLRFLLEEIRPELRQYFFESEPKASNGSAIRYSRGRSRPRPFASRSAGRTAPSRTAPRSSTFRR
jgi:hypothetical protein